MTRCARALSKRWPTRFPEVVARIYPLELGPPVGWPVKYRVSGPDPQGVRSIALQVADLLGATAGVRNVNFDWVEPARVMRIQHRPGPGEAAWPQFAGRRTGAERRRDRQHGDAGARQHLPDRRGRAGRTGAADLAQIAPLAADLVVQRSGGSAAADRHASSTTEEYPIVWRRNRVPTLTVQADVVPGVLPATAVQAVQPRIDKLAATLPSGYRIATGGSVEESGKAKASVLAVVPAMVLVVLIILIFQLQSFQRVLLVLSVAPLGVIGVVAALLLAQAPLGFVAILGVLALGGMIARNSVILIDQIEHERAAGTHPWDAVVTAAIHRTRPILLTASAATLGMIPIAPTVFWGPMAFAIIGGLAVATVLTLIFLPALYVAWFRIAEPAAGSTPVQPVEVAAHA